MVQPQPTKGEVQAKMSADAEEARKEFEKIKANSDKATFEAIHGLIASWWERWFRKAGHKRLAYILMGKPMPERRQAE